MNPTNPTNTTIRAGIAYVQNTPIWLLEGYRRMGANDEMLLAEFPYLGVQGIILARDYALTHPEEMDVAIRAHTTPAPAPATRTDARPHA